ncbi:MAG: hypothetical protein V3W18_11005 [candidate division Zixibacteria bacterium]
MKINLVSDATYYPVRAGQNNKTTDNQAVGAKQNAESVNNFNKVLMDKLSPGEATAIRKLFGDFNTDTLAGRGQESNRPDNNRGALTLGKFVDITV